jgi:hypothetical protein
VRFSKEEIAKTFDICDTRQNRQASVYPRNASFDIAKQLGLDYFIQLDDDYTSFMFRWAEDKTLKHCEVKDINQLFAAMIEFVEKHRIRHTRYGTRRRLHRRGRRWSSNETTTTQSNEFVCIQNQQRFEVQRENE